MMASLASSSRELTPCSGMRDGVGSEGWLLFDVTEKLRDGQGTTVDQKSQCLNEFKLFKLLFVKAREQSGTMQWYKMKAFTSLMVKEEFLGETVNLIILTETYQQGHSDSVLLQEPLSYSALKNHLEKQISKMTIICLCQ